MDSADDVPAAVLSLRQLRALATTKLSQPVLVFVSRAGHGREGMESLAHGGVADAADTLQLLANADPTAATPHPLSASKSKQHAREGSRA